MDDVEVLPEIKEVVGALLFAARQPVTVTRMTEVFQATAEQAGTGPAQALAGVTPGNLEEAIRDLGRAFEQNKLGLRIVEVAGGYRLENDTRCGPWLRQFLDKGKPNRLSPPALETLAIIAYRQPVIRSEIEAVRGVAVDQIVRNLLDLQLIRAVGRSDLPGRPWMFGTTQRFLEHFGLRSLDDLPGVDELRRMETKQRGAARAPVAPASGSPASGSPEVGEPDEPGIETVAGPDGGDDALPSESGAEVDGDTVAVPEPGEERST